MKRRIFILLTGLFLTLNICCNLSVVANQQTEAKEYHGADSIFKANGITIFWAILKGSEESDSWVYIKIINPEDKLKLFQAFSLIAFNPFSDSEE